MIIERWKAFWKKQDTLEKSIFWMILAAVFLSALVSTIFTIAEQQGVYASIASAGEGVGVATVQVLYGNANPSGRLAETFPLRVEDNPSYLEFGGDSNVIEYREGLYVGYRYYTKKKMPVSAERMLRYISTEPV